MSIQSLTHPTSITTHLKALVGISPTGAVTCKIVSLRIHVERAIGRIKQYSILSGVVPLSLVGSIDNNYMGSMLCACIIIITFCNRLHLPLYGLKINSS